jgi:hypothetical protein
VIVGALLGGCSASDSTATRQGATSTTSVLRTPKAGTTTLTDQNNGQTISLHPGDRARVLLSNTYWTFQPDSAPAVLRSDGPAVVRPQLRGCVPGEGCGTVMVAYTAIEPGTATITATRTTCGEAISCTPANDHFQITFVVD